MLNTELQYPQSNVISLTLTGLDLKLAGEPYLVLDGLILDLEGLRLDLDELRECLPNDLSTDLSTDLSSDLSTDLSTDLFSGSSTDFRISFFRLIRSWISNDFLSSSFSST